MLSPTKRQMDALRFIVGYQEAHNGVSPSMVEIVIGLGLASKENAYRLLTGLEERGIIRRMRNRARAIEVLRPVSIPRGLEGEPLFYVKVKHG